MCHLIGWSKLAATNELAAMPPRMRVTPCTVWTLINPLITWGINIGPRPVIVIAYPTACPFFFLK